MAQGKFSVSRQEVNGEPTRAQHRFDATSSASLSILANCGKKRAQTASYRKEKQQAA
ncbi:hypothetical protein Scep_014398 [Stephania cephalantha]|uniref:Uncharacterized protein n=1 Tax=Stephania cephalantha TaxID=152367 RepID=A0AAP0J381_9MAGN